MAMIMAVVVAMAVAVIMVIAAAVASGRASCHVFTDWRSQQPQGQHLFAPDASTISSEERLHLLGLRKASGQRCHPR